MEVNILSDSFTIAAGYRELTNWSSCSPVSCLGIRTCRSALSMQWMTSHCRQWGSSINQLRGICALCAKQWPLKCDQTPVTWNRAHSLKTGSFFQILNSTWSLKTRLSIWAAVILKQSRIKKKSASKLWGRWQNFTWLFLLFLLLFCWVQISFSYHRGQK